MCELLLELDVIVEIVVGQRVLVPVEAQLLDRAPHPEGHRVVVGPGRIEHHRERVADHAAYSLADLDVELGLGGRMDLVGRPAVGLEPRRLLGIGLLGRQDGGAGIGGRAIAVGAEQPVDRHPRHLARDVPERDVHGADGAQRRLPRLSREEPLVEPLAVERVLSHDDGLQRGDQRLAVQVRPAHRRAEKGVALDTLVGLEREQTELALPGELGRCGGHKSWRGCRPSRTASASRRRSSSGLHVPVSQSE